VFTVRGQTVGAGGDADEVMDGRDRVSAVVALVLGGCATSQEWSDWKSHPTHFASGSTSRFR